MYILIVLILAFTSLALGVWTVYREYRIRKLRRLISELKKWHELALTDDLTGIPNRASYSLDTVSILHGSNCAVLLFDIDDFKNINDTFGHLVGDNVLRQCAALLCDVFAAYNGKVYRIGGDEFAVLIEDANDDLVKSAMFDVRNAERTNQNFKLSRGYAFLADFADITQCFDSADRMLYTDKISKKVSY